MSDEHNHDHHSEDGGHSHHRRQGWGYMFSRESWGMTAANFRASGLPWHKTLLVAAANYWRKVRRLQVCCGNVGHPGC